MEVKGAFLQSYSRMVIQDQAVTLTEIGCSGPVKIQGTLVQTADGRLYLFKSLHKEPLHIEGVIGTGVATASGRLMVSCEAIAKQVAIQDLPEAGPQGRPQERREINQGLQQRAVPQRAVPTATVQSSQQPLQGQTGAGSRKRSLDSTSTANPAKRARPTSTVSRDSGRENEDRRYPRCGSPVPGQHKNCPMCKQAREVVACLGPCRDFFCIRCLDETFRCNECGINGPREDDFSQLGRRYGPYPPARRERRQRRDRNLGAQIDRPEVRRQVAPQIDRPDVRRLEAPRPQSQVLRGSSTSSDNDTRRIQADQQQRQGNLGAQIERPERRQVDARPQDPVLRGRRRTADRDIMSQIQAQVDTYRPGAVRKSLRARNPPDRYES